MICTPSLKRESVTCKWLFAVFSILFLAILGLAQINFAAEILSPQELMALKTCTAAAIRPDGQWIAYTVSVPRSPDDKAGGAYSELYLVSSQTGEVRPFITGKTNVSTPIWSPDGSQIAFLTQRGEKAKTQVWMIRFSGGEARQITDSETDVLTFRWHPSGEKIAYIATAPKTRREQILEEKGYGFVYYEENLKQRNLYLTSVAQPMSEPEQLTWDLTIWDFQFSPNGQMIAAAMSAQNLIDQQYMFQKIHLIEIVSKNHRRLTDNPGKLGNFSFSPDGSRIVYAAAREQKDHAVSQVYVIDVKGGGALNLTIPDFRGHVEWVGWKDKNTVLYYSGEGVWPTLSLVPVAGGNRTVILHARDTGIIFDSPSFTIDFKHFTFFGSSTTYANEIFYWQPGKELKRLTTLNSWLAEKKLGRQEVIRYRASDGLEIEGLLIYPVDYQKGSLYPLVVIVHGGPESNYSNGWVTRYSEPGQVLAGRGYFVFYPNYRASTGYGADFALQGYQEPAGKEFDDVADGIDFLVNQEWVDPGRVGLGGGSYGGYAAAWFSSYYTKKVRAVCMFVGISNLISKRNTTDIPYEELYVHSGKKLEDMWSLSLQRSPIYWAHQSQTAVLILGGTADTRVDPSQSMEYYRRLKMNNHPAVRLVQYPGEGHGNRKQPGRIDLLYRILEWYDWYVKDKKPLEGPMPPFDLSDKYGINLDKEN